MDLSCKYSKFELPDKTNSSLTDQYRCTSADSGFLSMDYNQMASKHADSQKSASPSPTEFKQRRNSSGQKLAKFFNILTPYRHRAARRSRSFGDLTKNAKLSVSRHQVLNMKVSNSNVRIPPNVTNPLINSRTVIIRSNQSTKPIVHRGDSMESIYPLSTTHNENNPMTTSRSTNGQDVSSCSIQLDLLVQNPTKELYEFRRQFPVSFLTLCTNYLGFLTFTASELDEIRQYLVKEGKMESCTTSAGGGTSPFRTNNTPRKMLSWLKEHKQTADSELEHWYLVVNTILRYMISNQHYKHRFIFRRPGNHTSVNDLEKLLFGTAKSVPPFINNTSSINDQIANIHSVLSQYDVPVIACLLARVLRYQGCGLIPIYLRRLFIQMVCGVREKTIHHRRTIRLLFQLCPSKLVDCIVKPLVELMAWVAHESDYCQVDESSLAVLFAPIMFLDRTTCTPITLANPLPARVVEIFVRLAKTELESRGHTAGLFQVPAMFVYDCQKNLALNQISDSPALFCSLKYCVTMTPSPRSQGKKPDRSEFVDNKDKSVMPRLNLTAAFIAKRSRPQTPSSTKDVSIPVVKSALHCPTLDFRVRRTPTHNVRSECYLGSVRSPISAVHMDITS